MARCSNNTTTTTNTTTSTSALTALLFLVVVVAVGNLPTAAVADTISTGSRSSCSSIAGCASCTKLRGSKMGVCTRCKDGAVLVAGKCSCPAGYGATGTANTVRGADASPAQDRRKKPPTSACSLCSVGAYAPAEQAVGAARCIRCTTPGTTTPNTGATSPSDCTLARPGWYHDGSGLVVCSPNHYCTGNVPLAQATRTPCPVDSTLDTPQGSHTNGASGQDALADCLLLPGFYCQHTTPNVCTPKKCEAGSYCVGGASVESPGASSGRSSCPSASMFPVCPSNAQACPLVTSPLGSTRKSQCTCACPPTVTTVAGTGSFLPIGDNGPALSAGVATPFSVAYDATTDAYYVSSSWGMVVRKVSAAGIITTFAGTGTGGVGADNVLATTSNLFFPSGVAVNPTTGDVYVADQANNRIRKISGGIITTIAGIPGSSSYSGDGGPAISATMKNPLGMDVDQATGDLYFADGDACVVRRISTTATPPTINTVAGTGNPCGYNADGIAATTAQLDQPVDVKVGGGKLYIAESNGNRVRLVDLTSNPPFISTIAGTGIAGFSGDDGQAVSAQLNHPSSLAYDSALATLYVSDTGNKRIRKITGDGKITTAAGDGTAGYQDGAAASAKFGELGGLVIKGNTGKVLIADYGDNRIREYAP